MNETDFPGDSGCAVREDGQGAVRAGRGERYGDGIRCFALERFGQYREGGGCASTIQSRDYKYATDLVVEGKPPRKYIVRRLTPTECARLQGFPDWWCEGLGGSDSAIYKAYGNGLALPCAYDVLARIVSFAEKSDGQAQ